MFRKAISRSFFWLVIFGAVVLTVRNIPDPFQKAVSAYRNGDYVTALTQWHKLAQNGDVAAQYNLGALYASGRGANASYDMAHEWFLRAADSGNAAAQYEVAQDFEFGRGVAMSMPAALEWLRKSAHQGFVPAQIDLGLKYLNGTGVEKNQAVALSWFTRATGPDRMPPVIYGTDAAMAVTGKPCVDC